MAVADTINSLKTHLGEAYASLEEKGATIPDNKNVENLADSILSISGGSIDFDEYFIPKATQGFTSSGASALIKNIKILPDFKMEYFYSAKPSSSGEAINSAFNNFSNLEDISPLRKWDTSNVYNMGNLFKDCSKLADFSPIYNWNVSKVTAVGTMFYRCTKLKTTDFLSNWNLPGVVSINEMFYQSGITSLNGLHQGLFPNITSCSYVFRECKSLVDIHGMEYFNSDKVTSYQGLFYGCTAIAGDYDLSNICFDKTTNATYMFYNCSNINKMKIGYTGNPTASADFSSMFYGCTNIKEIDLSGVNKTMTSISSFAYNCKNVEKIDIRGLVCSNLSSASSSLYNVPKTCTIIVKDTTEKNWWISKFSAWGSCFKTLDEL